MPRKSHAANSVALPKAPYFAMVMADQQFKEA
jgi:hypothetical protein